MKNDTILQEKVIDELKCDLLTAACKITVSVSDKVITLAGKVDDLITKQQAEDTTLNVVGVQSVINRIDVNTNSREQKNDIELTTEILNVFKWNWNTLNDTIKVSVANGWITLSGEVEWNYQKEAAKTAVSHLIGVKGVTNNIAIRSDTDIEVHTKTIERALKSHADIDVTNIIVTVSGHNLTLSGSVDSSQQKELAGRIAWKAPGVISVNNELLVEDE